MAGTNSKYRNLIRVFRQFTNAEAPLSVAEIAEESELSSATLSRLLGQMQEMNLILEVGKESAHTGRSKSLYALNPRYSYTLSIFLDQHFLTVSIVDFARNPVRTVRLPVDTSQDPEPLLDWVCDQGKRLILDMGALAEKVHTVGVTISGWVHTDGSKQYVTVAAIPMMKNFEVRRYIQKKIGLPTYLDKDTIAGVLSAAFDPSLKNIKNLCFFRVTDGGVGFSAIVDGKVYRGRNGYLGESPDIRRKLFSMKDVRTRAYELYQNKDNLLRKYIDESGERIESAKQITAPLIDRAARDGDADVLFLLSNPISTWAEILENICCYLAPDVIILGDNLNERTPFINNWLRDVVNQHLSHGMQMDIRTTKKSGFMEYIANDFAVTRAYKEVEKELARQSE